MKIGIIGSNSFLGKNLTLYLAKKNKVKKFSSYSKFKKDWLTKVCKEIKKFSPDIIINCSAAQLLDDNKKSLGKLIYSNLYAQSCFVSEAKKKKILLDLLHLELDGNITKKEIISLTVSTQPLSMQVIIC